MVQLEPPGRDRVWNIGYRIGDAGVLLWYTEGGFPVVRFDGGAVRLTNPSEIAPE